MAANKYCHRRLTLIQCVIYRTHLSAARLNSRKQKYAHLFRSSVTCDSFAAAHFLYLSCKAALNTCSQDRLRAYANGPTDKMQQLRGPWFRAADLSTINIYISRVDTLNWYVNLWNILYIYIYRDVRGWRGATLKANVNKLVPVDRRFKKYMPTGLNTLPGGCHPFRCGLCDCVYGICAQSLRCRVFS